MPIYGSESQGRIYAGRRVNIPAERELERGTSKRLVVLPARYTISELEILTFPMAALEKNSDEILEPAVL